MYQQLQELHHKYEKEKNISEKLEISEDFLDETRGGMFVYNELSEIIFGKIIDKPNKNSSSDNNHFNYDLISKMEFNIKELKEINEQKTVKNDKIGNELFNMNERTNLINEQLLINKKKLSNTKVIAFDGLLMNFAQELNANIIIRGLRAVSDFDYEFQMTGMNARLNSEIETVFLMASEKHQFISSRFVKEICILDGDVKSFIPKEVFNKLKEKLNKN